MFIAVRPYLQLFVGALMSYLRYLCLLAYSGIQHILCCVFALLFFVLFALCCQFTDIITKNMTDKDWKDLCQHEAEKGKYIK